MATVSHSLVPRTAVYGSPVPKAPANAPAGTFLPGTKVQVGNHRVIIEKYLSEGGFAHVYVVRVPLAVDETETAVLKRVAVPDKEALANMRTEVETMKKLKGHKHIVSYIDSHASQLKGGGYEVFLLMEYCSGGGLIDFMNTRLQHRLTEPEIMNIFSDIAEGVACMHYLKPPLLHRDLKVENVLISKSRSTTLYKLCDFGSTAPPRPAARTAAEGRLIEDDVQKHTTLQYRSPEMVDVYRKQPIDEKSDIWALGVLLYKLCYYTTPFEEQGQMAILTASFKYPAYPAFSNKIKLLIASMLREDPKQRPNIYHVLKECCAMRGVELPIEDIYADQSQSKSRKNEPLPSPSSTIVSPPTLGAYKSPPPQLIESIPSITPMRRGRPTAPPVQHNELKPSISPSRPTVGDPFAALDSTSVDVRNAAVDELATKFPSLDEFSLLHEPGSSFEFLQTAPASQKPVTERFRQRVTNALADGAFAKPMVPKSEPVSRARTPPATEKEALLLKAQAAVPTPSSARQSAVFHQPTRERSGMVSVGTMTSQSPPLGRNDLPEIRTQSSPLRRKDIAEARKRPVWRIPSSDHHRSSSQPRASGPVPGNAAAFKPPVSTTQEPGLFNGHRQKPRTENGGMDEVSVSSCPSLESQNYLPVGSDISIHRSKSATTQRTRPSSEFIGSNLDYLRDREGPKNTRRRGHSPAERRVRSNGFQQHGDESSIKSDMDFLRAMEEQNSSRRSDPRSISDGLKHNKRASMPSLSLAGTKNILTGKFGDAFKRFETSTVGTRERTPSPLGFGKDRLPQDLSPVTASDNADAEEAVVVETEELSPEMRREIERRRLAEEERRVEAMAAEHKRRIAERGRGGVGEGPSRASAIQNKVRNLLDESGRASPPKRANGYGRYTAVEDKSPATSKPELPQARVPRTQQRQQEASAISAPAADTESSTQGKAPISSPPSARPAAPPKPKALRKGGQIDVRNPSSQLRALMDADARQDPRDERGTGDIDGGLEGFVSNSGATVDDEDVLVSFSKRYPSVSGFGVGDMGHKP